MSQNQKMTQLLKNGIKMYYKILKLHNKKLPAGKIRNIGNVYVKYEFRQHHINPDLHFYPQFLNKWNLYIKQLQDKSFDAIAKPMSQDQKKFLNQDQKQALNMLKKQVQNKKDLN